MVQLVQFGFLCRASPVELRSQPVSLLKNSGILSRNDGSALPKCQTVGPLTVSPVWHFLTCKRIAIAAHSNAMPMLLQVEADNKIAMHPPVQRGHSISMCVGGHVYLFILNDIQLNSYYFLKNFCIHSVCVFTLEETNNKAKTILYS